MASSSPIRRLGIGLCGMLCLAGSSQATDEAGIADGATGLESLSRAFGSVYERVAPAVVQIQVTLDVDAAHRSLPSQRPLIPGPFWEEFSGLGSGTIVSTDGYILSNYHVIKNARTIEVTLADRRSVLAEVVGVDSLIDIAVLKIDIGPVPAAPLGDCRNLRIGDWVLAIGFPLGMGTTLTHGIVSALGRQASVISAAYGIESFIQTNAVINPGNSGGPLLDLHGNVIGVNTAISTRTGYYIGYGLAVPIELAREAMRDLLQYGRVVRGYLGIDMGEITQKIIDKHQLDMETPRGVYVDSVRADTPAENAGLLAGDILLRLEGQSINHPNQVQSLIYDRDPGERVELLVLRRGEQRVVFVELGEREEDRLLALGRRRIAGLGLTVERLSLERSEDMGHSVAPASPTAGALAAPSGVTVAAVEPDGPAASRGLRVDDVITEVDGVAIESLDDFVRSVSRLEPGKSALFWIWRTGRGVDVCFLRIEDDS